MSLTLGTTGERARVLEIQRMSTEDGPGIRTTVFLKGCSLACSWCHNPESISPKPEIVWYQDRCIACMTCVDECGQGARSLDERGATIDPERCVSCYECVEACPTTAIEKLGTDWSLAELLDEVRKDRTYFETSGGGVTLSGGEPILQASFAEAFLGECRRLGIHTAVDTCGFVGTAALLKVAAEADLVLFDIKEIDPERHRQFTQQDNTRILENVQALVERRRRDGRGELWIRTPLIPGMTATEENISGIGAFIAEHLADQVTRWELCAFNNLCESKYRRLGRTWLHADTELMRHDDLQFFAQVARRSGVSPDIVHVDGPTQIQREVTEHRPASEL